MVLTEYRIPFPATVDEYRIGMMFMIARATKDELRRGDGSKAVELVSLEKYWENDYGLEPGIYTEKVFHIERFLPRFLRPVVPTSKAKLVERAWASYPNRCLTLYSCPFLGEKPVLTIESRYLADRGDTENALLLTEEELSRREVVTIDIAAENGLGAIRNKDGRLSTSDEAGRGPLVPGLWTRSADPVMCAYKVCRIEIAQPRLEAWGQRVLQSTFVHYNRQVLALMDSWIGLSLSEIPDALPEPPEKARTIVATELATEFGLEPATEMFMDLFDRSDTTNPFA